MSSPAWLTPILAALALLAPSTSAGTYKKITIDGSFDDWIGVPLAFEDPADTTTSADYRRVWVANDDDFLYVRFTLETPVNPFTSRENIFLDADADSATGYSIFVGSEMLIQSGTGYQEKNGGFNEGAINGLDWQAAPAGAATQFELRISRQATYASDQTAVFASPTIALLLESENANFARQETAPDTEGLTYEFAAPPPPFTGSSVLIPQNGPWRYWTAEATPPADWTSADFDDATGWSQGSAVLGYSSSQSLATTLPTGRNAQYFRTRFNWSANPDGVVFVATNLLSDGAVFFLNGAEVKRVRLPAGDLVGPTPATGGPAVPGEPELFALPVGPLVVGENVLAVANYQSPGTPGDLFFGLSLLATTSYPATLTDSALPTDRAVVGGASTTFAVDVLGSGPLSYTWRKDGVDLPDATNATLVLDNVLPADAGTYSVVVRNPANPSGATSRAAVLTVLSTPVVITRPPSSLTVNEGQTAQLSVEVTGSAPITYQWFKDGTSLAGATNATLEFASVAQGDAGDYLVEVSNPATTGLRSAAARLQVARDTTPPALLSVAGSPNRVVLTFSEPLDAATAGSPSSYAVSGGLTVTAAQLDAADGAVVTLTTSPQTLGTSYAVTATGIKDRFGNALPSARRSFLSTIQIDGSFEDWAGLEPVVDDPADAENATDYAKAWITSDRDFVYLRVQLHQPSQVGIFYNNLFINGDADPATGFAFRGVGSEMLIQGGGGYQQKGGTFNEGGINGLDWLLLPEGVASEVEFRFSRRATYASDGLPVFTADTVALFLESENTSFVTVDVAPDTEPIVHQFLNPEPTELPPVAITTAGGRVRLSWTGEGRLQASPTLLPANWQEVAGATSPHELSPTGTSQFFRIAR